MDKIQIGIIGWGIEGHSLAAFVHKRMGPSAKITVLDSAKIPLSKQVSWAKFKTGKNYLKKLEKFDLILRSSGVRYWPEIERAVKRGVALSTITNIFFQEILAFRKEKNKSYPKIIAITGTKGKGTVASLLYAILKKAGKQVVLAGNIGVPMLDILEKAQRADYIILELSSFQTQDLKHSADVAVLVPISSDHLDYHKDMKEYLKAKSELFKQQNSVSKAYYIKGKHTAPFSKFGKGKKITVSTQASLAKVLNIVGQHNLINASLAARVAKDLGISKTKIASGIKSFKGLPHRLELVRQIKGISFYDDSSGTNPETAIAAIQSFDEPSILILGGKDKGLDHRPLAKALRESSVGLVILMGENSTKIQKVLSKAIPQVRIESLTDAVKKAYFVAKNSNVGKINVILSPASASFDMFKNAYDRGDKFQKLVKKLK